MHVHSFHSGMMQSPPLLRHVYRECYSPPEEVYDTLKRRGMRLVTLTDHDSIDGAEALRGKPDFFLSEEVTCLMPSGAELHAGVYDLNERQHTEIQRRRSDLISLLAYLSEQKLLFSVNHAFSVLTGQRFEDDFDWFAVHFPALETRNGHLPSRVNRLAMRMARRLRKASLGGSDAHTLDSAGSAYTVVPGARNKTEFLDGLWKGQGRARGRSGSYWKLTRDAVLITGSMMQERPCAALLAPLALLIPAVTLAHILKEVFFVRRWREIVEGEPPGRGAAPRGREARILA